MNAGSLDANVLLRVLLGDIPDQQAHAIALLESGGTFSVSDTALIETNFVLGRAYGLARHQQREAILGIIRQPMIDADEELFEAVFELFVREPKLSFEDCYLLASAARARSGPLWTFDRKLAAQEGSRLVDA